MAGWIAGKIDAALQNYLDGVKQRAFENIDVLMDHLANTLEDISYIASLYGGAGLIIASMCGSTRAKKYFALIQVTNVFIQGLIV